MLTSFFSSLLLLNVSGTLSTEDLKTPFDKESLLNSYESDVITNINYVIESKFNADKYELTFNRKFNNFSLKVFTNGKDFFVVSDSEAVIQYGHEGFFDKAILESLETSKIALVGDHNFFYDSNCELNCDIAGGIIGGGIGGAIGGIIGGIIGGVPGGVIGGGIGSSIGGGASPIISDGCQNSFCQDGDKIELDPLPPFKP